MKDFYNKVSLELKENNYDRSAMAIQKKESDFTKWLVRYKKAVTESGLESIEGTYHTFIPLGKGEENEEKAKIIMENLYSAMGQSPNTEPEILEQGSVDPSFKIDLPTVKKDPKDVALDVLNK